MMTPRLNNAVHFYILIRSWNSFAWFDRCVESVFQQSYPNYTIIFVDDNSGYTAQQRRYIKNKLKGHICVFNKQQKFAVRNAYEMLHAYAVDPEAVVVNLDGDDWLYGTEVLSYLATVYEKNNCWFTYGNCLIYQKSKLWPAKTFDTYANTRYPRKIVRQKKFRREPFRPLHLRTWKVWLFKRIRQQTCMRVPQTWLKFCEDMVFFFPFLEMAYSKCQVITQPLSVYNQDSLFSDAKHNLDETLQEEIIIRKQVTYENLV